MRTDARLWRTENSTSVLRFRRKKEAVIKSFAPPNLGFVISGVEHSVSDRIHFSLEDMDAQYEDNLTVAEATDLTDVESKGIIRVVRKVDGTAIVDKQGNFLIMMVPGLIPKEKDAWERSFLLFLRESKEVS